jgi:tetratricopeptide (TPR) repeat protein
MKKILTISFLVFVYVFSSGQTYKKLIEKCDENMATKNYEKVLELSHKAILKKPNKPEGYYYKGGAYERLFRYTEAIKNFNKVIEIDPDFLSIYSYRGNCYAEMGNWNKAIIDLNKAISKNPL